MGFFSWLFSEGSLRVRLYKVAALMEDIRYHADMDEWILQHHVDEPSMSVALVRVNMDTDTIEAMVHVEILQEVYRLTFLTEPFHKGIRKRWGEPVEVARYAEVRRTVRRYLSDLRAI